MRTLTGASKHDSTMYTRMTLENILVVNQYVGLYGENPEKPDEEYFEYIPGTKFYNTNQGVIISKVKFHLNIILFYIPKLL